MCIVRTQLKISSNFTYYKSIIVEIWTRLFPRRQLKKNASLFNIPFLVPRHSCLRSLFRPTFEELLKVTGIKIGGKGSGNAEGSGEKGDWLSFSLFFFFFIRIVVTNHPHCTRFCSTLRPLADIEKLGYVRVTARRVKKIEGDANYETIFPYIAPLQPRRLRFNLPVDELKIDRRLGRRTLEITYIWNSRDPSPFLSFFSPPPEKNSGRIEPPRLHARPFTRLSTFPRLLNTTRSNRTIRRPTPTAPR